MIASEILLYPDSGPEFLRALKMAILYTNRVHVLTLLDEDLLEKFSASLPSQSDKPPERTALRTAKIGVRVPAMGCGVPVPSTLQIPEYLSFIRRNREDFSLLIGEGVLTSDFPGTFSYGGTFRADATIQRVCERWPPSYWDFLQSLPLDPHLKLASFQGHLCFISWVAQQIGACLATWSLEFQVALWESVAQLAEEGPISTIQTEPLVTESKKREHLETALAHTVLQGYVPRVDDLPFPVILDLRRNCAPELERFRHGLQQLAADVDVAQSQEKIDLQLRDVVSRHIDPAVQALAVKMAEARLDLVKKVIGNLAGKTSPIGAGIGLAVAAATGHFEFAAVASVAGGVAAATIPPLADMVTEQRKAIKNSNWAILFRLNKLQRTLERLKPKRGFLTINER